jgi:hypothetical protein
MHERGGEVRGRRGRVGDVAEAHHNEADAADPLRESARGAEDEDTGDVAPKSVEAPRVVVLQESERSVQLRKACLALLGRRPEEPDRDAADEVALRPLVEPPPEPATGRDQRGRRIQPKDLSLLVHCGAA